MRYAVPFVFLLACSGGSDGQRGLAGKWSGSTAANQHYDFTIVDQGGALSGAGFIDPGNLSGDPISVSVTGAVAGEDVSLRFDAGGTSNALAFTGVVIDPDHIAGQIEGDPDIALSLERIALPGEDRPPVDQWQTAEDRLVEARCNAECGAPIENCESSTHAEMAQARAELGDAEEPQCIACMNSLAELFETTVEPSCMATMSDVFEVCEAEIDGTTITLHACNGHPAFPMQ